jgi:hypothetical protein
MKTKLYLSTLLLALCGLAALPVSADTVKSKTRVTLSVTLEPTVDAPVGATGTAEIRIRGKNAVQTATMQLAVSGLVAGAYTVDATLADASVVNLGSFDVPVPVGGISIVIPATVNALNIASIDIKDASSVVLLHGDATTDIAFLRFFANVRVTGPDATTSVRGPKKVHGHCLAHSLVIRNVERESHFLWVAFGAPASTELTINVDGVPVGTVTSTKQGKVKFNALPDTNDFAAIDLITLTDSLGAVVMQAEF